MDVQKKTTKKVHLKALSCFPQTIDKAIEILDWLTTQNKQLENYSPKRFLAAKPDGEKQVLALLDKIGFTPFVIYRLLLGVVLLALIVFSG